MQEEPAIETAPVGRADSAEPASPPSEKPASPAGKKRAEALRLSYFDEVLAVELYAINARRAVLAKATSTPQGADASYPPIQALPADQAAPKDPPLSADVPEDAPRGLPEPAATPAASVSRYVLYADRMRPTPVPCTATGLALSGGGIRSAAFCLGALQALNHHGVIDRTDYMSTVSGGGYIGGCMTACMSLTNGVFPFGGAGDVRDNGVLGHLRNYSNYLMPSAHTGLRNAADVTLVLLRGLVVNAIIVGTFLLAFAIITAFAFPSWDDLPSGNFLLRLVAQPFVILWSILPQFLQAPFLWIANHAGPESRDGFAWLAQFRFAIPLLLAFALPMMLVMSVGFAKLSPQGDAVGEYISAQMARRLLGALIIATILDLQPLMIFELGELYKSPSRVLGAVSLPALAVAIVVALFARRIGIFLEAHGLASGILVRILQLLTRALVIGAALVVPFAVVVAYWCLSAWLITLPRPDLSHAAALLMACGLVAVLLVMTNLFFAANNYSLHQFYKDRLEQAFLLTPQKVRDDVYNEVIDNIPSRKLSELRNVNAPYHIINAALNVQGSREANRRGRNADFFTFTPHFVGSDLTHFASTRSTGDAVSMEDEEPTLDFPSAIAISGAALSANMGASTVRWLSPTFALLNVRLGYWLSNPRDLAKLPNPVMGRGWLYRYFSGFYLLLEMLNLLDEERRLIYLTDGGHIENLGIYQLLKRGCRLIVAIDAEADPEISCHSLVQLQRHARIDLGVRIWLPWEQIAARNHALNRDIRTAAPGELPRHQGPHCAVGSILYENGSRGVLLYVKSSLSGDENDYILNYKKRNPAFPHETTGDQFFTEEQFEVYRSLGYHAVDGFFSGNDAFAWMKGPYGWDNAEAAKKEVMEALRL